MEKTKKTLSVTGAKLFHKDDIYEGSYITIKFKIFLHGFIIKIKN